MPAKRQRRLSQRRRRLTPSSLKQGIFQPLVQAWLKKAHISETPATQFLRRHGLAFSEHPYTYEEHGGTVVSARALGVDGHHVVKALVGIAPQMRVDVRQARAVQCE